MKDAAYVQYTDVTSPLPHEPAGQSLREAVEQLYQIRFAGPHSVMSSSLSNEGTVVLEWFSAFSPNFGAV